MRTASLRFVAEQLFNSKVLWPSPQRPSIPEVSIRPRVVRLGNAVCGSFSVQGRASSVRVYKAPIGRLTDYHSRTSSATKSAIASAAVRPGDSIPNRLMSPLTPVNVIEREIEAALSRAEF